MTRWDNRCARRPRLCRMRRPSPTWRRISARYASASPRPFPLAPAFRNIKSWRFGVCRYDRCPMHLRDPKNGYSWLSIALHWVTAIIILTLWFIGSSINADRENGSLATLYLHTSIAISAYALLWARIVWRFWIKHPGPIPAQAGIFYEIGKYTHYLIIA